MERAAQLSEAQLEIMRVIWDHGGTVMFGELAAVLERQGKRWKTNTILTFLARLAERGMLEVKKRGRLNEYVALISEEAYLREQTKSFIDSVYGGNAKHLLSALLRQNDFSPADYEELQKFWEEAKR